MKNSRHEGDTDSDRPLFILRFRGLSIKKKTFFSRALRTLEIKTFASDSWTRLSFMRFRLHLTNDPFLRSFSRNESRNEAPSIVQLIFSNFSKKCRRDLACVAS